MYLLLMYSGFNIGIARKKSFESSLINFAPSLAPNMTLSINNLVSSNEAAGAPVSPSDSSLSPPAKNYIL